MLFAPRRRMEFGVLVFTLTAFFATLADVEQLSAADGPRPAWTTSKITGTPTPPPPYAIRPAFSNLSFDKPTSIEELQGGRILISEIGGNIYTFKKNSETRQKDLLLTIDGGKIWHTTAYRQSGTKWELFVCYSKDGTSYVSRYQVSGDTPKADPQSEEIIITWPAGGHNAGCLRFGTDGMLYISTGDGSGPNPPDGRTAAQDVSNLFGCMLRIDIRNKADGKNYSVPADNPFVDLDGARPEIWAYGLRNPWKFGVDRKTGDIFAADNGWESWEMVHRIVRGGNCGWPIMEGRAVLRSEVTQGPTPIRPPVKDHSHTEANSVIGGPIYRGNKLPELDGTFIYGDYITGTIWGLKSDGKDSYSHQVLVDTDQRITAFAEGSTGELYVLDYDYTGQIYELIPSGLEDKSANFPKLLSETGLFTSLKAMTPAPGVVPYDVVVERWVDGATTKRWVAIPDSGSINLGTNKTPATYPEGTVFAKHLTLPINGSGRNESLEIPLETQLLQFENGMWHPYSYIWNDDRTDATLVDSAGTDHEFHYSLPGATRDQVEERSWHANAENECRMCHNAGSGFVLGFVPNQLDRALRASNENIRNQLDLLARHKVIAKAKRPDDVREKLVDPHDETQSLNDRARSYLHGNCSSCHHPGGNAIVSFYLRRELPFKDLKTNKGTGIGTFGLEHAKLIVPGDPYRSVLLYRMSKLGYARMPYIGSRVVDSRGVALIEKWIGSMPHQMSNQDSPPIRQGSREQGLLLHLSAKRRPAHLVIPGQQKAVFSLLQSTAGALALSSGIHSGAIRNIDTAPIYKSMGSDIRGLFETFIPEKSRRKTLGRNIDPETVLALEGNATRGRLIFYSDGARCRNCHDLNDSAKSTGPTLVEIRKKYSRRSEMLTHILKPSLKVDEKFATWSVVTDDGKIHNGLLVSQSDSEVVLKTAERKTVRIAKSEIDVMKKSPQSLMPEAILSDQTAQEAADLLAWFGSQAE